MYVRRCLWLHFAQMHVCKSPALLEGIYVSTNWSMSPCFRDNPLSRSDTEPTFCNISSSALGTLGKLLNKTANSLWTILSVKRIMINYVHGGNPNSLTACIFYHQACVLMHRPYKFYQAVKDRQGLIKAHNLCRWHIEGNNIFTMW